jgi:hypothetical protein
MGKKCSARFAKHVSLDAGNVVAGVLVADQEVVLAAAPQSSSFGLSIRMIDAITERT